MSDNREKPLIFISVRGLVEFVLRSGDIDNRFPPGDGDAMQKGSRVHRKLQDEAGTSYRAEVKLQYVWHDLMYDLVLDGRADGIITEKNDVRYVLSLPDGSSQDPAPDSETVTIDEIKGTYRDLKKMARPLDVHLSQAKCYAFMYAEQEDLPFIRIRMTYCHLDSEEVRYFHEEYTRKEIREWFSSVMDEYRRWALFRTEWLRIRDSSIEKLEFPFKYRPGQKELVSCVWRTIRSRKRLFLEAPTGTGKTVSVLYPSIRALALKEAERIFYLTAKTVTASVAGDTLGVLRDRGMRVKSVVLTAREKVCFEEPSGCNPEKCRYAEGHYDRVNDAIYDLLTSEDDLSRETILKAAQKHRVCPFELSLDLSLFSDLVICDYNYVFDPHVRLRRFFSEGQKTDSIFLVDEAHNLVDRGREMYSASLSESFFRGFLASMKSGPVSIKRGIEACLSGLKAIAGETGRDGFAVLTGLDPFISHVDILSMRISEYLEKNRPGRASSKRGKKQDPEQTQKQYEQRRRILEHYFVISHFLMINDILDDKYVIYCERTEPGGRMRAGAQSRAYDERASSNSGGVPCPTDGNDISVNLLCADPSVNLRNCLELARSAVLFSATMLPIQYYKSLLGGTGEDYEVYARSVFKREQCGYFIGQDVTSRYSMRTQRQYEAMASYIYAATCVKKGNYIVFCPSHAFLSEVLASFNAIYGDVSGADIIVQKQGMTEEEREEFLGSFTEERERTLIAFSVMGGIFSEGIDLRGSRLIGAVIIGTGIPMVTRKSELLRAYFDGAGKQGYDYAYRFPGMNKVLQAAGRVIRTTEDRGIVLLLDNRFLERQYVRLFPREWEGWIRTDSGSIADDVTDFWD